MLKESVNRNESGMAKPVCYVGSSKEVSYDDVLEMEVNQNVIVMTVSLNIM